MDNVHIQIIDNTDPLVNKYIGIYYVSHVPRAGDTFTATIQDGGATYDIKSVAWDFTAEGNQVVMIYVAPEGDAHG